MRTIGLHLRIQHSVTEIAQYAQSLSLPFFQCFLRPMGSKQVIHFESHDIALFRKKYRPQYDMLFLHASYWINLASPFRTRHIVLEKELQWAKRLSFTHMIMHPGSAKGARDKMEGIDALARALNMVLKKEHDIKIVLENTAHGNMAVGSDIHDFFLLRGKLDYPDRVLFCIDTAHAFAYGYDICNEQSLDNFVDLLEKYIGIHNIALLHVNDTHELRGSCMDRHHMIGSGMIGEPSLKRFALHPALQSIPMLVELPIVSPDIERAMLEKIHTWHQ